MGEWGWVIGGYALTAATLLGYVVALGVRERAARRARQAAARRRRP